MTNLITWSSKNILYITFIVTLVYTILYIILYYEDDKHFTGIHSQYDAILYSTNISGTMGNGAMNPISNKAKYITITHNIFIIALYMQFAWGFIDM